MIPSPTRPLQTGESLTRFPSTNSPCIWRNWNTPAGQSFTNSLMLLQVLLAGFRKPTPLLPRARIWDLFFAEPVCERDPTGLGWLSSHAIGPTKSQFLTLMRDVLPLRNIPAIFLLKFRKFRLETYTLPSGSWSGVTQSLSLESESSFNQDLKRLSGIDPRLNRARLLSFLVCKCSIKDEKATEAYHHHARHVRREIPASFTSRIIRAHRRHLNHILSPSIDWKSVT